MKDFLVGLKKDWNKIVWSDKKTIKKEMIAVLIFSIFLCILIMGVDTLTQYGVNVATDLISKLIG